MVKVLEKCKDLPDAFIYTDSAEAYEENYLSWEDFGALYYDTAEIPEESSAIENYCLRISKTPEIHEIHIIKTKYKSDNDLIMRMLKRRAKILCSPQINPYSTPFISNSAEGYECFFEGNFVFLIAGSNAEGLAKEIKNSL